ncbi:MAG TPA: ATP-binding protein [Thermoanaerobaculia bacterium]|jgi:PAS domain S-box-containing protein|nr:ATP-binding protein [Thermoanaerobaculia bacterium]
MDQPTSAPPDRYRGLSDLSERLRFGSDPEELLWLVAQRVGEALGVARSFFVEVDTARDRGLVRRDYRREGVPSIAGEYRLSAYSAAAGLEMEAGRAVVNRDSKTDPRTAALYETTYGPAGERAYLAVPLHRRGRWVAALFVSTDSPRDWTAREVELLDEVAERTWNAIEKLRLDAELRASEARFRNMADHAPMMVWVTDAGGECTFLSQSWYRFTGRTPDSGLGRGWTDAMHPDDRPRIEEAFGNAMERRGPYRLEYRLRAADGAYRWVIGTAEPTFGGAGELLGYIGSDIDITERRAAEEALREAGRRKDEFLAMLAHELRNPLAPIRNAAQVLKLLGSPEVDQRWALDVIERQAQHLTRLVDDLLDVSRITQGKIALRREWVEVAAVVQRAVEETRSAVEERGHRLHVRVAPEPVRLEGDLTRLVQVVGNLLHNAAKYTPERGDVWLDAGEEDGRAVMRVRDDGIGLSAELLPHVFDLFTQADRSLDRSQGGLGIGLTLVRQLVELHGGEVEARSEGLGKGSEFIVRLPRVEPAQPADGAPWPGSAAAPPQGLRILVVEDHTDSAEMLAFLLRLEGHEVRTASDGPSAIEAAGATRPQVVLCDIGLPGMSGYEVAAKLRQTPEGSAARLIALSGYGQAEDRRRSREAGFDYHLTKPVEPDALLALLASLRDSDGQTDAG